MKNRFLFGVGGLLSASVIALLGLVGCGGGGESSSPTVSSISGSVEASKIIGASVCIAETCAKTDSNGNFTITGFAPPQTLEIKVGGSVIGEVNATANDIAVTPKLLADNNATLAPYIGMLLHKAGGCAVSASSCDLSNITSLDVNASDNKPLVQEIAELLTTNPAALTIKVNGNDENITSSDLIQYQVAYPEMVSDEITFSGAAKVGDYATFTFDSNTNTLTYDVNGTVFGPQTGTKTLTNLYGNVFFTDSNSNFYFFSGSLGVAMIDINATSKAFVTGMQTPPSIDTSLIVNKRFNYVDFDPNGGPSFSIIDINATNPTDTNGTWNATDQDGSTSSGTWALNGTHLDVKDVNGTKIANAVIRPSSSTTSRAGFLLDKVGGQGFGIGVEARPLSPSEMSGTFSYLDKGLNPSTPWSCYGTTTISNNSSTVSFSYQDSYCIGTSADSRNGTLILNPTVSGLQLNGLVQVSGSTTEFAFIDPESGYFISVDIDPTDPMISIGSNKPLQ